MAEEFVCGDSPARITYFVVTTPRICTAHGCMPKKCVFSELDSSREN